MIWRKRRILTSKDKAGREGLSRIKSFLRQIGLSEDRVNLLAKEIWNKWLSTGHWWPPSREEILLFLEGEL